MSERFEIYNVVDWSNLVCAMIRIGGALASDCGESEKNLNLQYSNV